MNSEATNELWFVEANGEVFETSFDEMASWINDGSLLRQDKVRKGNLRWIEAGKVPSLSHFFNAKDNGDPMPVVPTVAVQPPPAADLAVSGQAVNFSPSAALSPPPLEPICSMHDDVPAAFICDTCTNLFCKTCPSSYGGTVKICPFCGAMCHPIAQVAEKREQETRRSADINDGFGLSDLAASFAYPFKFKTSLVMGALMFMFFSIGESVVAFGGIFMLVAAIFCFLLANTLTFGILANTVENFSQGKIGLNFMPSFEDFSLWDDVVHPFFLSVGIYLVSFGPLIVLSVIAFFTVFNSVGKEMTPLQSDAARTVTPELPYAANAASQSEKVRELLNKTAEQQKERVASLEQGNTAAAAAPAAIREDTEDEVMRANQLIQQQRKAQLESAFGKTAETRAQEQTALVQKVLRLGLVFLCLAAVLVVWGFVYFPAACCVAAYTRSFTATLNPTVGLDTIRRLGFDYAKILGMGLIISLVSAAVGFVLSSMLHAFDMPGLGNVPAKALGSISTFYFSIVFSCVVGFALYKASDRLKLFR